MQKPELLILQNLLLAINAHINLDLGIVAAELCPGDKLQNLQDDFNKINAILSDVLEPAQFVISKLSPLIEILDKLGGRKDEFILNFSIRKARQEAWNNAKILAYQTPDLQKAIIKVRAMEGLAVLNPYKICLLKRLHIWYFLSMRKTKLNIAAKLRCLLYKRLKN